MPPDAASPAKVERRALPVPAFQCAVVEDLAWHAPAEPIDSKRFWKHRRDEAVFVWLSEYEGHRLIDARTWFTAPEGSLKPGRGPVCAVRHLPPAAVNKALSKARELGLVDPDGEPRGQ
jgi:hypothetical protein